jgi:myosin heavy subunit
VDGFNYLSSPKSNSRRDVAAFNDTLSCLKRINITDTQTVFSIVAGVLWLGNITFVELDNDSGISIPPSDPALANASRLLGLPVDAVRAAITTRKIVMNEQTITKPLTLAQGIDKRDALAKLTYESLFLWLVKKLNDTITTPESASAEGSGFIGILDIYGFECFPVNGFEQLLINYANEALQRHFNRHLFEVEQDLYEREGIDWSYIDFRDNRPCLELIEGVSSNMGILQTLDDAWGGVGAGVDKDAKFVTQLHQAFGGRSSSSGTKHPNFETPRVGFDNTFVVVHYAGEVKYTGLGFVDKNVETLSNEIKDLGHGSSIAYAAAARPRAKRDKKRIERGSGVSVKTRERRSAKLGRAQPEHAVQLLRQGSRSSRASALALVARSLWSRARSLRWRARSGGALAPLARSLRWRDRSASALAPLARSFR